jgi:hypothetical protein
MAIDAAVERAAALTERDLQQAAPAAPVPYQSPPELPPAPVHSPSTVESADQLRAEIETRKRRLAQLALAESMQAKLDGELARAQLGRNNIDGAAAQLIVLDCWLTRMAAAHRMRETIVNGRDQAADVRAARPRPREERPASAAPWLYQR